MALNPLLLLVTGTAGIYTWLSWLKLWDTDNSKGTGPHIRDTTVTLTQAGMSVSIVCHWQTGLQ